MAPWEAIKKLKELYAKLTGDVPVAEQAELARYIGMLALVVETQQHDIQVLKATMSRLEHHIRHHTTLH
jgi:hypothetical protein